MPGALENLFEGFWKNKTPAFFELSGENAFLEKEIKESFSKNGFEIVREQLKASPLPEMEDWALGTSLFQPKRFLWLQSKLAPARWSGEGQKVWDRMRARADENSLVIFLQVPTPAAAKKGAPTKGKETCSMETYDLRYWAELMNRRRQSVLDKKQMAYLMSLDLDLMALENAIELWSLGGDTWAREALGYGQPAPAEVVDKNTNPSFAWVDAVLAGKTSLAVSLAKNLTENGSEILLLVGLLTKSLKIWAALEEGATDLEPPFLVTKIQKLRREWAGREGTSRKQLNRLVQWVSDADIWMKSKPVTPEALLLRISEAAQI